MFTVNIFHWYLYHVIELQRGILFVPLYTRNNVKRRRRSNERKNQQRTRIAICPFFRHVGLETEIEIPIFCFISKLIEKPNCVEACSIAWITFQLTWLWWCWCDDDYIIVLQSMTFTLQTHTHSTLSSIWILLMLKFIDFHFYLFVSICSNDIHIPI